MDDPTTLERGFDEHTRVYVRNPGTGVHPLEAERLVPVEVEILHGPQHPTAVVLPILAG